MRTQCARLLAKHGLRVDISALEGYASDREGTERTLLRSLASRAAARGNSSDGYWDELFCDATAACDLVYGSADADKVLAEFCGVLLRSGKFLLAERFLDGRDGQRLSEDACGKVCVSAARELFFSSSSFGNRECAQAKQCLLAAPRPSEQELKRFKAIEALASLSPAPLGPRDFKHVRDARQALTVLAEAWPGLHQGGIGVVAAARDLGMPETEAELAVAECALEAGDLAYCLDKAAAFVDENDATAANFVFGLVRALDEGEGAGIEGFEVDPSFVAELCAFALCHCAEGRMEALVKVLGRSAAKIDGPAGARAGLAPSDGPKLWVEGPGAVAVSGLLGLGSGEEAKEAAARAARAASSLARVERVVAAALAAAAARAGAPDAAAMTPSECRSYLGAQGGGADLEEWCQRLDACFEVSRAVGGAGNHLRAGALVAGGAAERESAVEEAAASACRLCQDDASAAAALPSLVALGLACCQDAGGALLGCAREAFPQGRGGARLTLALCSAVERKEALSNGSLARLVDALGGPIYDGLRETDAISTLCVLRVVRSCLGRSGGMAAGVGMGSLRGLDAADLEALEHVAALAMWTERPVDVKRVLGGGPAGLLAEVSRHATRDNVCGFACLAQALGLSQRWCELHGTATSTSDVFLCQLERELSDPPARDATSDFLDHVTWTLPKLDDRGVARFADAVLASASAPADKAAPLLCDEARLGALELASSEASRRDQESDLARHLSSSLVTERARVSLDARTSTSLSRKHRDLLERGRAAGIDELRAALSDLSCLGVDLCSVAFAASAYGTLGGSDPDGARDGLKRALLGGCERAVAESRWGDEGEAGLEPFALLARSLEAMDRDCLAGVDLGFDFWALVQELRLESWRRVQAALSREEAESGGGSPRLQGHVLSVSAMAARWDGFAKPSDDVGGAGFDALLLVSKSNEVLDMHWPGGPRCGRDDLEDAASASSTFARLCSLALSPPHLAALGALLTRWEGEPQFSQEEGGEGPHLAPSLRVALLSRSLALGNPGSTAIVERMLELDDPCVRDEAEALKVFCGLVQESPASPALHKCALLHPQGEVRAASARRMAAADEEEAGASVDAEVLAMAARVGLLGGLCGSAAFVGAAVSAVSAAARHPGAEAEGAEALAAPLMAAELVSRRQFRQASSLVCAYLRTCPELVTTDAGPYLVERYLKAAATAAGTEPTTFRVEGLDSPLELASGRDQVSRALGELAACW